MVKEWWLGSMVKEWWFETMAKEWWLETMVKEDHRQDGLHRHWVFRSSIYFSVLNYFGPGFIHAPIGVTDKCKVDVSVLANTSISIHELDYHVCLVFSYPQ